MALPQPLREADAAPQVVLNVEVLCLRTEFILALNAKAWLSWERALISAPFAASSFEMSIGLRQRELRPLSPAR